MKPVFRRFPFLCGLLSVGLAALSAGAGPARAATAEDSPRYGIVIDALTGAALAGVEVFVELHVVPAETLRTDAQGRFPVSENLWLRIQGTPLPVVASPKAAAPEVSPESGYRIDGRALEAYPARAPAVYPRPSAAPPTALAKSARVQGGPYFRLKRAGYESREDGVHQMAFGFNPSAGSAPLPTLVFTLIPLLRPGACPTGP